MASVKTPIMALQETCVKHSCMPVYELLVNGVDGPNNTRIFTYRATAFGIHTEATATSKQQAKHKAAEQLLENLKRIESLVVVDGAPVAEQQPAPSDAISVLTNKCIVKEWPMPTFQIRGQKGPPHQPIFTYTCRVGPHTGDGEDTTKKGAQKRAAEVILRLIEEFEAANIAPVPDVTFEPTDVVVAKFERLTKRTRRKIAGKNVSISDRHRYFESFPDDKIESARAVLCGDGFYANLSDKEKVLFVLSEFDIPFDVSLMSIKGRHRSVFELTGDFDCVFCEDDEEDIWPQAFNYLKTMLNIEWTY